MLNCYYNVEEDKQCLLMHHTVQGAHTMDQPLLMQIISNTHHMQSKIKL